MLLLKFHATIRAWAWTAFAIIAILSGSLTVAGETHAAGGAQPSNTAVGEKYVPTIWVDPDGCEHWVFDDGWEGYMTPNVTRDGKPVCRTGNTCAVLNSDQMFASNRVNISQGNRQRLIEFFRKAPAKSFLITGHTDNRASDAYNMALSQRRADAVASIARQAGVVVFDSLGYGERMPKATNRTAAGKARNRRVEIICMY